MADTEPSFAFDPGDITLGELEILESHGVDLTVFEQAASGDLGDTSYATMLRALVFITQRRSDPSFTWEHTATFTLNQMAELLEAVGELDPVDPTVPRVVA